MHRTAPALITPAVLVWARESLGYEVANAADKLSVNPEQLLQWESGKLTPSVSQLKTISKVYKRPFSCFYLPERPVEMTPPRDFRRIHEADEFKDAVALNLAIRAVEFRREAALELAALLEENIADFPHALQPQTDPDTAGNEIRGLLGINTLIQRSWRDPRAGFNAWRTLLEKSGVLVCQFSGVNLEEARGFSVGEFPLPAVAVNSQDAPAGRTFTLVHELVHVMLRQSGTCDTVESYRRTPDAQQIEVYCNAVAGSALVPTTDLRALLRPDSTAPQKLDDSLTKLSREFSVSPAVILRRFFTLGIINKSAFERKHREIIEEYERRKQVLALKNRGKKVIITPAIKLVANAGVRYVSLVIEALHQKKISHSDVSDYLSVRLRHLPKIETELERRWLDSAPIDL